MACCLSKNKIDAEYTNTLEKKDDETRSDTVVRTTDKNESLVRTTDNEQGLVRTTEDEDGVIRTTQTHKVMKKKKRKVIKTVTTKTIKRTKTAGDISMEHKTDEEQLEENIGKINSHIKGKRQRGSCPPNYRVILKMKKNLYKLENHKEKIGWKYRSTTNSFLKIKEKLISKSDDEILIDVGHSQENAKVIQERRPRLNIYLATKKVLTRPLNHFEIIPEEETCYSYEIHERRLVLIKLDRIKINKIQNIIGNSNRTEVIGTNLMIIPLVFDLILKKLTFLLTKGEISSKFMCDLDPEVRISFGNKTRTLYYEEKRVGSKNNKKESNESWNLNDTPNKYSAGDLNVSGNSQTYLHLDDLSFNLSDIEDQLHPTPKSNTLLSISFTKRQPKTLPANQKPSDFSISIIPPRSTSTKLQDRNPFDLDQNNLQIFTFEKSSSKFSLSELNMAKEQKENNLIYFTVSQYDSKRDKNNQAEKIIFGEGYISILSLLELVSKKSECIYIPIFYLIENIQIANLKLELPTRLPKVFEDEMNFEEDYTEQVNHLRLFSKKKVTISEYRYYLSIERMRVIFTSTERKLKSQMKETLSLVLNNKLFWSGLNSFIQNEENDQLIDETKYLMLITSLNEILVESTLIDLYDNNTRAQMLKIIFSPFVYRKEIENLCGDYDKQISSNSTYKDLRKLSNTLSSDKKIILTDSILEFYLTMIESCEEIIMYEEFSFEFIFYNFERKFYSAKENHHKLMLEYLRYLKNRGNSLKVSSNIAHSANPEISPVTPPEQNPNFISCRNIIMKFMNIVNYIIKIYTQNLKRNSINISSMNIFFDFLKTKIPKYFLYQGSKQNSAGISKYDFLLLFTDKQMIISILEILINFLRLGSSLGYNTKTNFFESSDEIYIKKFFDYIFINFNSDVKILNLVLLVIYELLHILHEGICVYGILKLININYLFSFFIKHNKKITSKNFKNWIYFFSIISKITKFIKPSRQVHIDFIYLDWNFIFDNITRLYIISLNNFTKIPHEKYISFLKNSEKEISLQMFTSSNYLNKKFAIQIQMLFFDIFKDFMCRTEIIKEFYIKSKNSFRTIFNQICFLCLLSFQDSHIIIAEKEMRRFYFKMLVTLMSILTKLRDECDINFVEEFKFSLAAIVPNESRELSKIMSVDSYLQVMIPKLKNLIEMNMSEDSTMNEKKVTNTFIRLIMNNK